MHQGSKQLRAATAVILALLVCIAYLIRYRYWLLSGGLEASYTDWASLKYFGGIGGYNVKTAQLIVQGELAKLGVPAYPLGYPALIAAVRYLGIEDPQKYRLVQIGFDSLACVLAYLAARGFGARRPAAILAAIIYACAPWWTWSSSTIMSETLVPAFFLGVINLLQFARARNTPVAWVLAGVGIGVLPLIRQEMILLFIPLCIWAVLQSGPRWKRRIRMAVLALCGFALLPLAGASVNYRVNGHFLLSDNISGYVLYGGLGQLPNTYGFFVSDAQAGALLQSLGMKYRSPESERYWKSLYWKAWREHPRYVLSTIAWRFGFILWSTETVGPYFLQLGMLVKAGLVLILGAALVLAIRRRYDDILLLIGPLSYALATNGIMYAELRYVRYAHLSSMFGAALIFDGALAALAWLLASQPLWRRRAVAFILMMLVFVPFVGWAVDQTKSLDHDARAEVLATKMQRSGAAAEGTELSLRDKIWRMPDANLQPGPGESIRLTTSPTVQGYQLIKTIETRNAVGLALSYEITVTGPLIYLTFLNRDLSKSLINGPSLKGASTGAVYVVPDGPTSSFLLASSSKTPATIEVRYARLTRFCAGRYPSLGAELKDALFPNPLGWPVYACE
jgi:4-amino-4-deoxy-L-arabinose transferase-like glycosyltransferase